MTAIVPLSTMAERLQLDRNPAAVYLASLPSPTSRYTMGKMLELLASWVRLGATPFDLPWHEMRYQHTAALRARLVKEYSPAYARKGIAALRGVLKHAWKLQLMSTDDYQRAIDLEAVRGESEDTGRYLPPDEMIALLAACAADPRPAASARDAAVLSVLYSVGPREESVVALDLSDYDPKTGRLTFRHAKGDKPITAYLDDGAKLALTDWLNLRGYLPGPLFLAVLKQGGIRPDKRLTKQVIYNIVKKRTLQAGLEPISPHSFRRTSISDDLSAGVDLLTVSDSHGHKDPKTTKRYDLRPERAKQEAARTRFTPYKGRHPIENPSQ